MSRERRHAPFGRPYAELRGFAVRGRFAPTPAETALWARVSGRPSSKNLGVRCRRQVVLCGYIADFYVPAWKLVVELDGAYHRDRGAYDRRRDQWLAANGYQVIRFTNNRVLRDIEGVIAAIVSYSDHSGSA